MTPSLFSLRRLRMAALTVFAALMTAGMWSSCGSEAVYSPELAKALDRAARNRKELMEVLEHYENEPEKLAAAKFLIRNMHGHYSYQGAELDSLETFLAQLTRKEVDFFFTQDELKRWEKFLFINLPRKDDLRSVTAEMLIENIDLAFKQWKERPWNRNLSFEDFCELILPYSISDDQPVKWRKLYADHYNHILDSLYQGNDVIEAAFVLLNHIQKEKWIYNDQLLTPHRTATSLFKNRVGFRRDWCDLLVYAMRSCGIPVTTDNILFSPDNHHSYQWIVVRDPITSAYYPVGLDDYIPDRSRRPNSPRTIGKVYRQSFARQEERMAALNDIRSLPVRLNNPFLHDVTAQYFGENSASVDIRSTDSRMTAYLGLWTDGSWEIIDTGQRDGDRVTFRNIEPGVIFVPVRHTTEGFVPCGDAFYLTNDSTVKTLHANPDRLVQKARLRRTRPFTNVVAIRLSEHISGYTLAAADNYAFTNPDTLLRVNDSDTVFAEKLDIALPSDKHYRYLRMSAPKGKRFTIGELDIFDDAEMTQQRICPVIEKFPPEFNPEYLQDGIYATRLTLPADRHFFTYDLGQQPAAMASISFNTDKHFITKGKDYEIYYLNADGNWTMLNTITAQKAYIDIVVPGNAMLMICRTGSDMKGQAFIYRNGRQMYSYDLARLYR